KNLSFYTLRFSVAPPPTEPVFEVENLSERVKLWINWNYDWSTCTTFCKRDFIISNQIFFSAMKTSEDIPFNFKCLMRAKKYLSVPNVNYIIRPLEGSISRDNPNLAEHFHKRIGALNAGCNELDRIMKESDFFNRHYNYRYAVLEWFVNLRVAMLFKCCSEIPPYHLNYLVRKEFHTDDAAFASCLFNMVNLQRNIIEKLEAEIKELKSKE
ncbi:MAG: hypothetical protein IKG61_11010, partial [Selenomonadaceae bacterium]|nr:hypothetical protein [Selenomonadaceae bacterium]